MSSFIGWLISHVTWDHRQKMGPDIAKCLHTMRVNFMRPRDVIWWHMSWSKIGWSNGLLPDSTKPWPEPMLTCHQWSPLAFTWGQFQREMLMISINKLCLKITHLKFEPDLPGTIELTHWGLVMPYGDIDQGQHWLRKWLVAWWHQAITWTNVD